MLQTCGQTCVVDKNIYTSQWLEVLDTLGLRTYIEVECNTLCALGLYLLLEGFKALLTTACDDNLCVGCSEAKCCSTTNKS